MSKNKKPLQRDANQIIEILFKISEAVNNTRNLDELYKFIHKSLSAILNVDNFYIALHHPESDSITFPYHVDEKDNIFPAILNFSKSSSITGLVIKTKKPMIFLREDIIQFANKMKQKVIGTIPELWLGSPLIINNKVIGVVVVKNYDSKTSYTQLDLNLLNSVSQHIALAIERKESNEKLKKQKTVLAQIIESSPVGICFVENRTFKWVNNEMLKLFGYEKKEDVEGCDVRMIYKSEVDYNNSLRIIMQDLKKNGKADLDFELKKKDNTSFYAHVIITGHDNYNPSDSAIVIITDISQREFSQQEKYEEERLKGVLELAGAVCHEINQPLQAILGYSKLLMSKSKSDEVRDYKLSSIKNQVTRIGEITKKISNITHYRTVEYLGRTKIVDIWSSGNEKKYLNKKEK